MRQPGSSSPVLRSAVVDDAQSRQLPLQVHLEAGIDPQEQHLRAEGGKKQTNKKMHTCKCLSQEVT